MQKLAREISNLSSNVSLPTSSLPAGIADTSTPLGKQAAEMWSSLDRLSNSDPVAYRKLIESMKEEDEKARRSSGAMKEVKPVAGVCLLAFCKSRRPPRDSEILRPTHFGIRPEAPPELVINDAIYVNICTHERVTPPIDLNDDKTRNGKTVIEVEKIIKRVFTTQELMNLEIPLGVDDIRRLPRNLTMPGRDINEVKSTPIWAVDCLVHSWVLLTAARDKDFKRVFADFILSSVGSELGINFDPLTFKYDKAAYVGGIKQGGKGVEEPVLFNVSRLMPPGGVNGTDRHLGSQNQNKEDLASKLLEQIGTRTKSDKSGGTISNGSFALESPSSLLKSIKSSETSDNTLPIRELEGLRLTGLPIDGTSKQMSAAELAAADFARQAASILPDSALIFSEACTISIDDVDTSGGSTNLVVRIVFNCLAVNIDALKISECELNVEEHRLRLFLPRKLLKTYSGLELENILVALEKLPQKVNPESAKAKFSRTEKRLSVILNCK